MLLVMQVAVFFAYPDLFVNIYYIIFSSAFFILGSVMPDIDSRKSIPHRHFKRVYYVLSLVFCFALGYFLLSYFDVMSEIYMWLIMILGAVIMSYAIVELSVRKLKHRGFLHSPLMALIYGTVIFLVIYVLNFGIVISFVIGFFAMYGWYFHRIVDKTGDSLKWHH